MSSLVQELIEAGIHFGHRASRWNPKMKSYIHSKRNLIHILDVKETVRGLLRAKMFLQRVVAEGKDVLFVGTKRQIREVIKSNSERSGQHYVIERWLGGTLTNFRTIRNRLQRLEELERIHAEIEAAKKDGRPSQYTKKAESSINRELARIFKNLSGIRRMNRLPGAVVLVDIRRETNAAKEARKLGIPVVCLIDTDGDPDMVDIPIPGNDDAMQAVEVVIRNLADSCLEGMKGRTPDESANEQQQGGYSRRRRPRGTAAARMMDESSTPETGGTPASAETPAPAEASAPSA